MEKKSIEIQKTTKKWHKPEMDTITSDELKNVIVSGACSDYVFECTLIRVGR